MSDESYRKLAKVLDTLPNGFPATESGLEIRLLEKIFEPEEAELFCDLRLTFETPEQIAERTGRPLTKKNWDCRFRRPMAGWLTWPRIRKSPASHDTSIISVATSRPKALPSRSRGVDGGAT